MFVQMQECLCVSLVAVAAAGVLAAPPCGSWEQVAPPSFQGEDVLMLDVVSFGPDSASGFGLTYGLNGIDPASIILTHWDGASWQVVSQVDLFAAPIPGIVRGVAAIDGSGPDNLWIAGTFDPAGFVFARPFLAHWDGASWSFESATSDGGSIVDIGYVSDSEIYLFGDNAVPWVWDGSSMSLFSPFPPVSAGAPTVSDVALIGTNEFWIAGHQSADVPPPSGFSLWNWNGSQWSEFLYTDVTFLTGDVPAESHIDSIAAIASDDVWAVGDKQLLGGGVHSVYLHWDGNSWTEVPGPQEIRPQSVAAVASDDVWAFGGISVTDQLLFAHWDGTSWSIVPQGTLQGVEILGPGFIEMIADPGCNGWALGRVSSDFGATVSPLVLRLQPGGGPCSGADFAEPFGTLDFFDVLEFLSLFTAQDPAADINADGEFNFFDVLGFLDRFSAGCP